MRGRRTTSAGVVALVLMIVSAAAACAPDTTGRATTTVDIACGDGVQAAPVDWWFPPDGVRPTALVWLQHGFVESKDDWRELAPKVAARGLLVMATTLPTFDPAGCNVENLGDNGPFLDNLAALFAGASDEEGALARSYTTARALAGGEHHERRLPQRLVFVGHSAGGETVLSVAERLRVHHPDAFAELGGLVLEDPVNSFLGSNFADALKGLNPTSLPVLTLASPPNACNAFQSGIALIDQLLTTRPFHGAQVTSGTHGDVFGAAVMPLEALVCGTPKPADVDAVQTLTIGWVADAAAGTQSPEWYPGGATYDGFVAAGTITTLP